MQDKKPEIHVVAAILRREGKFLIGKRRDDGKNPGLYEFVGGKTEPGETEREALYRECREEIGVEVTLSRCYLRTKYEYPDTVANLAFYLGEVGDSVPEKRVHTELLWVTADELLQYRFCPANGNLIKMLQREFGSTEETVETE